MGRLLGVDLLVIATGEQLCKYAASGPKVDLHAVVCVTVEKLGRSVISGRDVGDTASWKDRRMGISSDLIYVSPVMVR